MQFVTAGVISGLCALMLAAAVLSRLPEKSGKAVESAKEA